MAGSGKANEGTYKTPPYAFGVVVVALVLAAAVFLLVLLMFKGLIKDARGVAVVAASLGGLLGLFGTVVGAYFGIKITSDTIDKTQSERKRLTDRADAAHEERAEALAELPPDKAREIVSRGRSGN